MTDQPVAGPPPKLLAGYKIKFQIAGIALAILFVGAWLAPPQYGALTAPEERAAPLIEERVQAREAPTAVEGLQDAVDALTHRGIGVRPRTVPLDEVRHDFPVAQPRSAAGYGVVIDASYAVSHQSVVDEAATASIIDAAGATLTAAIVSRDPSTGLVLLRLPEHTLAPPAFAAEPLEIGAVAMAAATVAGVDLVIPSFVTAVAPDRYRLSAGDAIAPGMPIYTVTGELAAIAGTGGAAWQVGPAVAALRREIETKTTVPASIGLSYQVVSAALSPTLGDGGAVIVATVPHGPADRAGLREGDVIEAVNDGRLDDPSQLAALLSALPVGDPARVKFRRAAVTRTVEVMPMPADDVAALVDRGSAAIPEARAIFTAEVLAAAGVPPRATIVSIDRRPIISVLQAERAVGRRRGDHLVLLEHAGTRFFAILSNAP